MVNDDEHDEGKDIPLLCLLPPHLQQINVCVTARPLLLYFFSQPPRTYIFDMYKLL